jgi:HD-like signal output (HDOD) protein
MRLDNACPVIPSKISGRTAMVPQVKWHVQWSGARRKWALQKEFAMNAETDHNPRHHTQKMQMRLKEIDHLRADIEKVDEPQLKAMFETAAEVLGGLRKAFNDYERKNESAWR